MASLLPEFYLAVYTHLLPWIESFHEIIPKNEGAKWEAQIQVKKNGKTTYEFVTQHYFGYAGSYFHQHKMNAVKIQKKILREEQLLEQYYLKFDLELLKKIFIVLKCGSGNERLLSMCKSFGEKFMVDYSIIEKQISLISNQIRNTDLTDLKTEQQTNEQDLIESATSVVYAFFSLLNSRKFIDAWEKLSSKYRNSVKWSGSFDRFEEGYKNFSKIKNPAVFNCELDEEQNFTCIFYYEDVTVVNLIDGVESLLPLTLKEVDRFTEIVKQIIHLFDREEISGVKDMKIVRLSDPAVSEYIWFKFGSNTKRFHELFPNSERINVRRLTEISCILVQGKWFIDDIQHLKTYMVSGD